MENISVVILNYNNWEDTIECVDSLKLQTYKSFEIIIVDNYSTNNSFEIFKTRYQHQDRIHLLRTNENLGYAKGNNFGIKYSLERLGINNILVVNNDTIFTDKNYLKFLKSYNIGSNIGAIGSKITGKDGLNQNPVYIDISLKRLYISYISSWIKYLGLSKIIYHLKKYLALSSSSNDEQSKSFILHGSAIFLTENYFREANGFYPDTFLYFEEIILSIILDKLRLKMVYTDDINIYHKEEKSSTMNSNDKDKFKIKHQLRSAQIAIKAFKSSNSELRRKLLNNRTEV